MLKTAKQIADPVHGTISLTEVERDVVDCQVFQRLRRVKHLGLAFLVYPGADFSRFSHSLGTCHVMGRILFLLRARGIGAAGGRALSAHEEQVFRLAALLHDIGHYPFSHALETPIEDYCKEQRIMGGVRGAALREPASLKHELVGKEVLLNDSELRTVLRRHGIGAREICEVLLPTEPRPLRNLVSSDLDADRVDYLLRTAHHTGLPYGAVDIEYLLSQFCVDGEGNVCVSAKALRTAEHLLLCRYFDYQQVSYHKTTVGFECLLKRLFRRLLEKKRAHCSPVDIKEMIRRDTWKGFDDESVLNLIRSVFLGAGESAGSPFRLMATALLERRPPGLLGEIEQLIHRDDRDEFQAKQAEIQRWIMSGGKGIRNARTLVFEWSATTAFTKIGRRVSLEEAFEGDGEAAGDAERLEERYREVIRVLPRRSTRSRPIMQLKGSLMHPLADRAFVRMRVYAALPGDREGRRASQRLRRSLHRDLRALPWVD